MKSSIAFQHFAINEKLMNVVNQWPNTLAASFPPFFWKDTLNLPMVQKMYRVIWRLCRKVPNLNINKTILNESQLIY